MVPRTLRASLVAASGRPPDRWTYATAGFWRSDERCHDDMVDDKAIFICVDRLWRFGLCGVSAGRQGFSRDARSREHELRSLAVYGRASVGGHCLDSRFLDGTQLRCRGEWPDTAENQCVFDRCGSRKGVRSQSITNLGQRRMDDVSWGQEVARRLSGRLIWSSASGISRRAFVAS
jgi:hypothetical protein